MSNSSDAKSSGNGFWLSMGVLVLLGLMIGTGFVYAYMVV